MLNYDKGRTSPVLHIQKPKIYAQYLDSFIQLLMKNSVSTNFYFVIYQDDLPPHYFAFALTNVSGIH